MRHAGPYWAGWLLPLIMLLLLGVALLPMAQEAAAQETAVQEDESAAAAEASPEEEGNPAWIYALGGGGLVAFLYVLVRHPMAVLRFFGSILVDLLLGAIVALFISGKDDDASFGGGGSSKGKW